MTSTTTPAAVAAAYFEAWKTKDSALLRSIVADDVTFDGPMAQVKGADEYVESIQGLWGITDDVVIDKVFVDGNDVATVFAIHTKPALLSPVVNWSHVEDGKLTKVTVIFDPRPLLAAS